MRSFEIIGQITNVETIAVGRVIRDIGRLRKLYRPGRRRKLKDIAGTRLTSRRIRPGKIQGNEAHGIRKNQIKPKRYLD